MAITCEDLNVEINAKLQEALVKVAGQVKSYVDGQDAALKGVLKDEIVSELSKIDGLGEQLEKIQAMADAFSKAFDENEDGTITPEEILAKATLLQQAIDGVNGRVDALTANTADVKAAIEKEIEDLKARVAALETQTAQNRDEIAAVKADLGTNYASKECLSKVVDIKVDTLVTSVKNVFFPEVEEEDGGDGAVE